MKQRKIKLWCLTALTAVALSACHGGGGGSVGGGGGTGGYCYSCLLSSAWYDVYGNYCGNTPSAGCDFYANGDKITYANDPYFASLTYGTWYYSDVFGYSQIYTGWGRQTADGILFDDMGNALNSNETHGRDIITNAAAAEKVAINAASETLQARYGLEADVAGNIANALNDWALIGKSRKRTDADVAAFSKRLAGLDIGEVNAALEAAEKGDTGAMDETIAKAAQNWSTNPDTMKQILGDWFLKQQENQ